MEPVDLTDPEHAMPGELDLPPRTGPELAAMRLDSIEERLRALEQRLSQLERNVAISSSYLYIPGPGTAISAPSHNHNEEF